MRAGEAGMDEHELLELLLTYAIPRRDTKALAKSLITRFGSLNGVFEAETCELAEEEGIGETVTVLLKLIHVLGMRAMDPIQQGTDYFKSPETVADYFRKRMRGLREESFIAALLDPKNRIIEIRELQKGTVDQAVVYPRRVAEAALERRAKSVVIVHNHPSGDCTPSRDDHKITTEVKSALVAVGVVLLDHVVIGSDRHFSFRDAGLL